MIATCTYLVVQSRKRIFETSAYSPGWGGLVLVFCIVAGIAGLKNSVRLGPDNYLTVMTLSFWFFLIGTFLIFFGPGALLTAMFPMALLLFMIPWPDLILDKVVGFLQSASYTMTGWIFNVLGFFPLEKGFEFKFPELSIEVAPQCSGIRSSIVLVILSLIAGNFMLGSKLNRVLLVIVSVPVAIFKNGVRIAGLTLSAIYLDSRILSSEFHKKGGLPVFILAIGLLFTIVVIMRKLERKKHQVQQQTHVGGVPGASEQSPQ
jgi:exosortase